MEIFKLPSGAMLKVSPAPFADADDLLSSVLEVAAHLNLSQDVDMLDVAKTALCLGFSSKKIRVPLKKCIERAMYNDQKITDETFEPEKNRQDYLDVMYKVAEVNLAPFTKSLYAKFGDIIALLAKKAESQS